MLLLLKREQLANWSGRIERAISERKAHLEEIRAKLADPKHLLSKTVLISKSVTMSGGALKSGVHCIVNYCINRHVKLCDYNFLLSRVGVTRRPSSPHLDKGRLEVVLVPRHVRGAAQRARHRPGGGGGGGGGGHVARDGQQLAGAVRHSCGDYNQACQGFFL